MSVLSRRPGALSAQQVDPLSWVTGPHVPLVFGGLILAYGLTMAVITLPRVMHPGAQFFATGLCALACLFVHFATRPLRPPLGWAGAVIAMLTASCGMLLSALGYIGARFTIEVWWAPLGLAMVLGSLAPYLPTRRILVLGIATAIVTVPLAFFAVGPQVPFWGPVSIASIILGPEALGIVAAAIFSAVVVRRMVPMLERRSEVLVSLDAARSEEAEAEERRRLAELSTRVVAFLQGVAEAGEVSAQDRMLAGQIARQLRDDLVARSNLSWLDHVAESDRVVVVDPQRLANRMRLSQRTALRGFLRAVLEMPGADAGTVLVELRAQPDGSTAVGVSLDVDLPEGRRIMHLAPYYVTLRTAVQDLHWDDPRRLTFELPPDT